MSLVTQINSLITRIGTEFKTTKTLIAGNTSGDLTGLSTSAKTNLIAAINELKTGLDAVTTATSKNKGWYATSAELITAYPAANAGDYAIVGATDTIWLWDSDGTPQWKDGDTKGSVTSVNGLTGAVVIPQVTTTVDGLMIAADKTKLNGIAAGATANASDALLRDRSTHTGTQLAATISNFAASAIASLLTGFTTGVSTVVAATDSIVAAIGKLQAQITGHVGSGGTSHANAVAAGAAGFMTGADKTKLDGVAAGATANATDAVLKDRANHTGTQLAATISNFAATVIGSVLTGLSVATATAVGAADSILIAIGKLQAQNTAHQGVGGATHPNAVAAGAAGFMTGADKTKLDGVATGATANSTDAILKARANHTGTQLASTISDFASGVIAQVLTGLSVATNAAIGATDTILVAFGKLQAQLNGHFGAGGAAHANATTAVAGFLSGADKTKLDGLSNYSHPTADGSHHVPATGTGNNLKVLKAGATVGSEAWGNVDFAELTGKPTTIAGYGLTDVYSKTEIGDPTTDFVAAFNLAIA